jgi:nicotinamide riboside kinase
MARARGSMAKLIVNFLGSPNSRKTTSASAIFAALKKRSISCEMAAEVAKEYVLEDNKVALEYQLVVWAEQAYKIYCSARHADIVITDAPILLGLVYLPDLSESMCQVVLEEHRRYPNLNILMPRRTEDYSMVGRVHNEAQSALIQEELVDALDTLKIPYIKFEDYTEKELVSIILEAMESL